MPIIESALPTAPLSQGDEVPLDEPDRFEFIQAHRLGRLQSDFARDLHLRLLRAFASLGFDDHDWLSDPDLHWLVQQGKTDVARIEAELNEAQAEVARQQAIGKEVSSKRSEQLMHRLDDLREKVKPFVTQVDSRRRLHSETGQDR
jgi:hypothetical protein